MHFKAVNNTIKIIFLFLNYNDYLDKVRDTIQAIIFKMP